MKLRKKITKALRKADSKKEGYPDYDELARIVLKFIKKVLK